MTKNNFKVSFGNVCGNVSKICKRFKWEAIILERGVKLGVKGI
ncbi:hypothetical protein [Prevotella sp.]|jgi:hypothetical protein|nr:hypothetical protein [Prevotella sp.]